MIRFAYVCIGGGLGAGARYLVSLWAASAFDPDLPFGTFAVNTLGSFLTCALLQGASVSWMSPEIRLTLITGVMGGFTTYSTFNAEVLRLLERSAWGQGRLYLLLTLMGCLASGVAGIAVGRWVFGSA